MLGAVQTQRPAAEEPEDDQRGRQDAGGELEPTGERDEGEGQKQRGEEEEPLAEPGDAAAADERRHRRRQLQQAADERDPSGPRPAHRHLALVQLTGDGCEGPVALADDHDAVRPGHAAELRQRRSGVCACEEVGDRNVHLHRVAQKRPPGECRTA